MMSAMLKMNNWPKIETPIFKISDKFSGPIIILTGFIVSLWSNVLFVVCVGGRGYIDTCALLLAVVGLITHAIISFYCSSCLIKGLSENDPDYLKPWMIVKVIEFILLAIGVTIEFVNDWFDRVIQITPPVILFMAIGAYIFYCIYNAYKKMQQNPQPPPPSTLDPNNTVLHNMDKPPSYDSFENQAEII